MHNLWKRLCVPCLAAVLVSACANTKQFSQIDTLEPAGNELKIILMPLDVELSSLQASGATEPRAEWTETAKRLMLAAIRSHQVERGAALVEYDPGPAEERMAGDPALEIQKLHRIVGQMILTHKYTANADLPSKKAAFDWSLGPTASALAAANAGDYALFLFIRDSYSSSGRVALQLAASLIGVGVTGGLQIGFASLVDLRSGDIVWFNHLADASGDLRSEKGSATTIRQLLTKMPL